MAIWLVRAGSHGEYEQKFIQENRVYVTWDNLNVDLTSLPDKPALASLLLELYPNQKPKAIQNWVSQIWPFAYDMAKGDLVIMPLKSQPVIYVGEITGDYQSASEGPSPFYHFRTVKWIGEAIPRNHFGKDLLYSFGAFLTICRIKRNNAEKRITYMRNNGWKPETVAAAVKVGLSEVEDSAEDTDLEELAHDQIADLIAARFKGHGLTRLVEAILLAQGYTTYRSPEGPDGGVDILVGGGSLGFSSPSICVEVKSESSPMGREPVDKLLGAMTKFNADQGLFVAWGGYKANVQKELASQFFRLRLWSRNELLRELFQHYEQLDDEIKAELPLKRVWMVAAQDDDG